MQRGVPSKAPYFPAGIAMTTARLLAALCSLALIELAVAQPTQDYPRRPIRIVTAEPGGGNDFAARVIVHLDSRSSSTTAAVPADRSRRRS